MSTLQQIRAKAYGEIGQDSSNSTITSSEMDGFINEGVRFFATLLQWPVDLVEIQVEDGISHYTLLSDTLMLKFAYFGNRSTKDDVKPLDIWTEAALKEYFPSWLDSTSDTKDRPQVVVLIDKNTVMLHPRPNAEQSAAGKKLYLSYVYYPAVLALDADTPDLPLAAHDLLSVYAAHKCYAGKLNNPQTSTSKLNEALAKLKLVEPKVDKPKNQLSFQWGTEIPALDSWTNLADHRLF